MPDHSNPAEMQPEERLVELARIFAKAYHRFRIDGPSALPEVDGADIPRADQRETSL